MRRPGPEWLDQSPIASRSGGPTECILNMARTAPGGVIRWYEARDAYVAGSRRALRQHRRRENNFHIALADVLRRHFVRVEGAAGLYVLREMTESGDPD